MGLRKSTVSETPSPPPEWNFWYDEPSGPNGERWTAAYKIERNGYYAEMSVHWTDPDEDTVDIVVDEYPDPERNGERTRRFDVTVPKNDMQKEVNNFGEAWINAVDNE